MSGEKQKISLEGSLTVASVEKYTKRVHETLKAAECVVLDLETAREIDVSFLQLLCAAVRYAREAGKRIELKTNAVVEDVIAVAGFSKELGGEND